MPQAPRVFNEQDSEQKAYLRRMSDIADHFTARLMQYLKQEN